MSKKTMTERVIRSIAIGTALFGCQVGLAASLGGRVAVVADGNYRDPDDLFGTPISLAILQSEGFANKLVHYSHSCDLVGTGDPTEREAALQTACDGTAARWGAFPNVVIFYNSRTERSATVSSLKAAINASSASDVLHIVEAGEPDIIYFAMEEALLARRQHVRIITHSEVNDTTGDYYNLSDIIALDGVSESQVLRIPDQNKNLRKPLEDWYWARDHEDVRIRWLWKRGIVSQKAIWDYPAIVGKFDCSDAGMVWYWAKDDSACTVTKLKNSFLDFVAGGAIEPLKNATLSSAPNASTDVNLSSMGSVDWAIWGSTDAAPSEQKLGGSAIGDLTITANQAVARATAYVDHLYSWTDGTVDPSGAGVNPPDLRLNSSPNEVNLDATSSSITLTVAGSTSPRIVHVWGPIRLVGLQMVATINGSSVTTQLNRPGTTLNVWHYAVEFTAENPGDVLTLTLTPYDSDTDAAQEGFGINAVAVGQ